MRRALLPIVPLLLAGPAAAAEDFSGFYAGINVGYAKGRERDGGPGVPVVGTAADRTRPGPDLPPSAADAAARNHSGRRSGLAAPR